jgi:hypothetical protein
LNEAFGDLAACVLPVFVAVVENEVLEPDGKLTHAALIGNRGVIPFNTGNVERAVWKHDTPAPRKSSDEIVSDMLLELIKECVEVALHLLERTFPMNVLFPSAISQNPLAFVVTADPAPFDLEREEPVRSHNHEIQLATRFVSVPGQPEGVKTG